MKRSLRAQMSGGFTLIELVMYIVIVGIALAGVLSVLQQTTLHSSDPMLRKQALAVAEMMMEEVLAKRYQNHFSGNNAATPTLGCTSSTVPICRANTPADVSNYNDVDDYNGWNQSSVYQQDGIVNSVLGSTYAVAVTVAAPASLNGVNVKQVTVTVSGGAFAPVTLTGFRASYNE